MRLAPWKKTLYIVWLTQFIAITGGGLVFPFLPLYIRELGVEDTGQTALYAGLSNMTFGLAVFVFSPVWGALPDRYGRKRMLLRAYFAAMIIMALPAFLTNVWQFLVVRAFQGAFTGTVPAAASLVAATTPPEHVAYLDGAAAGGAIDCRHGGAADRRAAGGRCRAEEQLHRLWRGVRGRRPAAALRRDGGLQAAGGRARALGGLRQRRRARPRPPAT